MTIPTDAIAPAPPVEETRASVAGRVLSRARWLAVVIGSLMLLLALPATVLGGGPLDPLTDTVTEVTDPVVDTVEETPSEPAAVVPPVVEPIVETVEETVDTVAPVVETATAAAEPVVAVVDPLVAVVDPLVGSLPAVAADVEVELPLVEGGIAVSVDLGGATTVMAALNLDVPGAGSTGISVGTNVELPALPALPGDPLPGVTLPIDEPCAIPGAVAGSVPLASAGPPAGGGSSVVRPPGVAPPTTVVSPIDSNQSAEPVARTGALERLARELSRGFLSQGGGVALGGALALLTVLVLVPPLTRGGLLPAPAIWKPVPFVTPLDPPG
jgi:hypothetical protein